MDNSFSFLILIMFFLIIVLVVWTFVLDFQSMVILRNRLESNALASGWSGFSALSLEELSVRNTMSILDLRSVVLNKTVASQNTLNYIRKNLKLSGQNYPLENSYIADKSRPVLINITVYNQYDSGNPSEYTTIAITLRIPLRFGPGGIVPIYSETTYYANYDTFLIQSQKE